MNRFAILFLLFGFAVSALSGQDPVRSSPNSTGWAQPAGYPLDFMKLLTGQDQPEASQKMIEKILKTSSHSLVGLEIGFKKKTKMDLAEDDGESEEPYSLRELRDNHQSLTLFGVAIDEAGTLIVPDTGLPLNDVESITMIAGEGQRIEAEISAFLKNYAGMIVKPSKKSDVRFTPVSFREPGEFPAGSYYYATFMEVVDGAWHVNVSPYIVTNRSVSKSDGLFIMDHLRSGALIADRDGEPIGIALDSFMWKDAAGRDSFVGSGIVKDERIGMGELREKYKAIESSLLSSAHKFEIRLREDRDAAMIGAMSGPRGAGIIHVGVPLGGGVFFIPRDLNNELVKKIEEITVTDPKNNKHPAVFVGLYKDMGGYLVKCDALKSSAAVPDLQAREFHRGQLFLSAFPEERFGRISAKVKHNRVLRIARGLFDHPKYQPISPIKAGAFLVDLQAAVLGFCTVEKKEEELEDHSFGRYSGALLARQDMPVRESLKKLFLFGQIREMMDQPEKHFDKQAVPMSKKEEKSLVWLGVEFQDIGKPLAEELGVLKQTRDGKKGLLVTDVFPDSPAEKLGIRFNDILLAVRAQETGDDIDLILDDRGGLYSYPQLGRLYSGRRHSLDPIPSWKPRRNYLSTLLTKIGAGKKITLTYLRDKKDLAAEITLENAPADFEGAEKVKDDDLGITVKELTYEVRYFQKLEKDFTGVIVSRIEPGSRAEVAKLTPLSIIKNVNHERVKGLAHFKELVDNFKKSDLKSLTLELVNLGQTRFVDIPRE